MNKTSVNEYLTIEKICKILEINIDKVKEI